MASSGVIRILWGQWRRDSSQYWRLQWRRPLTHSLEIRVPSLYPVIQDSVSFSRHCKSIHSGASALCAEGPKILSSLWILATLFTFSSVPFFGTFTSVRPQKQSNHNHTGSSPLQSLLNLS